MSLVIPFEEIFSQETGLLARHESWERVELEKVVSLLNGAAFKSKLFSNVEGFPLIRIRDIARSETQTFYKGDYSPEYIVQKGDFLIGMDGNFACYEWAGKPGLLNQRVCKIIPDKRYLNPRFFLYGIQGYLEAIQKATSAQTVGHLSSVDILRIPFPLPPLAEQRRIVAKVEELLARVNAARERLARVPAILKRFRQSVLAAACSGRLTADWRGDTREENDLPETWKHATISEVATVCVGGTPSRKETAYWNGDVPWVSSGEVANCRIAVTKERITKVGLERSNAKMYAPGTVLIAMIGEGKTRGQTAILDIEASTNQNIAALITDTNLVEPDYVWRWAMGEYEKHRSGGRGGNYPALNARLVREFALPLPPLSEQREIVRRVKSLFKLADAIEKRVAAATQRVEKLTQAILAKAFRGELVPTEAELARIEGRDYEPASALLERIRAERNSASDHPNRTTRSRKKKPADRQRGSSKRTMRGID